MINEVFSYMMYSQITRAMATVNTPAATAPNIAMMTEESSFMVSEILRNTIHLSYRNANWEWITLSGIEM